MGCRRAFCFVPLGALLLLPFLTPSIWHSLQPFACLKSLTLIDPVIEGPSERPNGTQPVISRHEPLVSRSEVESVACPPHLVIDDLNITPGKLMLFADNGGHNGAQFGNQLFTGGWSIMTALKLGWAVVVIPRQPWERAKQIHKLPCLRSTRGAEAALAKICEGCNPPPDLWSDRNQSCNRGQGCKKFLLDKRILWDKAGASYWQNLKDWPTLPAITAREVLPVMFRPPAPKLDPPVNLPGSNDLVFHFRPYGMLIDRHGHLQLPPFDFWKWTVEHHKKMTGETGRVWLVTEPSFREYPTVLRLKDELGVQVFTEMDVMGKDAWLGDFFWLTKASSIALSLSTFSWWAGYLSKASTIYMVIPPMSVPMSWCPVLPKGDPRYVFYDFYSGESLTDGEQATQRCEAFLKCQSKNNSCASQGQNLIRMLNRYYPEVLAKLDEKTEARQVMKKVSESDPPK